MKTQKMKAWMLKEKRFAMFSPLFLTKKSAENYIMLHCLGCEVKGGYHPVQVEIREIKKWAKLKRRTASTANGLLGAKRPNASVAGLRSK